MNSNIFAHIISPKNSAAFRKYPTATDILAAIAIKEPTALSNLFSYPFCAKPVSFNMAENLPNRRSVTAFKSVKKAKYISYFLLEKIRRDMGNLTASEALVTMLLFSKAKTESDFIYADTDSFSLNIKPFIDPSLKDPFVMSVPKGEKMWFFSHRPVLNSGDTLNICGIDFITEQIMALENSGENFCLQSDFPANAKPTLSKHSKSLFTISLNSNCTKQILSGSVLDPADRLLSDDETLKPFLIKF